MSNVTHYAPINGPGLSAGNSMKPIIIQATKQRNNLNLSVYPELREAEYQVSAEHIYRT